MELTYTKHGDYYIPDLDIPAQEKVPVNRYGQMHGSYLKKNNRTAYNELLFSGRLNRYLAELGEQAEKMLALLTEQYAAADCSVHFHRQYEDGYYPDLNAPAQNELSLFQSAYRFALHSQDLKDAHA